MGYCIELVEVNVKIKENNINNVIETLNNLAKQSDSLRWVDKKNLAQAKTIEECFGAIRYKLIKEDDGFSIDCFTGEKFGNDFEIFTALAPYIKAGSFMKFVGEDGMIMLYRFNGKELFYKVV